MPRMSLVSYATCDPSFVLISIFPPPAASGAPDGHAARAYPPAEGGADRLRHLLRAPGLRAPGADVDEVTSPSQDAVVAGSTTL